MSKEEILDQVTALLVQSFDLDPSAVHPTAHLIDDLDLDSIDAIDLAVKMQEVTGRRLEEDDLRRIRTVADIVDVLEGMLKSDS